MVIQRLAGDRHRQELLALLWALEKNENVALIKKRLAECDIAFHNVIYVTYIYSDSMYKAQLGKAAGDSHTLA
ncbi:MAG: hypothetical protein PVG41_16275 [Desulfobacteraceae bacterium]|jgi:hypothetical protein